jgi:hypothetical protein
MNLREETKGMTMEQIREYMKARQNKQLEAASTMLRNSAATATPDFKSEWNKQTDEFCQTVFH